MLTFESSSAAVAAGGLVPLLVHFIAPKAPPAAGADVVTSLKTHNNSIV